MRVGVLGGSFDPIHIGHLVIAEEARARLALDRVIFVPAGLQWLKGAEPVAGREERLEMARLATAANPAFGVSDVELRRPGPSYSVDTVRLLREELGPDAEIFFILGQDALAELPRWHRPKNLLRLCHLVAFPRSDGSPLDLEALERALPGLQARLVFLEQAPRIQVSSTEIRARLARGESARYLVPDKVLEYIARRGLYLLPTAPPGS